ncbi:hypothetical protein CSA57_05645 [candidate division KSB3 bacterium]|nr:MAG: hypothetical protein CSA57_05645 [candidate division KSB3 bacterium]
MQQKLTLLRVEYTTQKCQEEKIISLLRASGKETWVISHNTILFMYRTFAREGHMSDSEQPFRDILEQSPASDIIVFEHTRTDLKISASC